jgi:parallel beta-helix repeat protein
VNNEIAYNNTVFGDPFWGAGGSKWVYANGLIVRGNFSHHNIGPGL